MSIQAYSNDLNFFCFVYDTDGMLSLIKCISDCDKRKEMMWKRRLEILFGIASALDFLRNGGHRSRFHGDVKSANVYVTHAYTAKLVDCSIAQLVSTDENRFRRATSSLVPEVTDARDTNEAVESIHQRVTSFRLVLSWLKFAQVVCKMTLTRVVVKDGTFTTIILSIRNMK